MRYLVAATLSRNALAGETRWQSILGTRTSKWAIDRRKWASLCRGRVAHPDDESVIDRPNCNCPSHEQRRDTGSVTRMTTSGEKRADWRNARATFSQTKRKAQRSTADTFLLSNCRRWLGKRLKSIDLVTYNHRWKHRLGSECAASSSVMTEKQFDEFHWLDSFREIREWLCGNWKK